MGGSHLVDFGLAAQCLQIRQDIAYLPELRNVASCEAADAVLDGW